MSDRVSIQLEPQAPSVMAGGQPFTVTATIHNTSDIVDAYDLRLEGIPNDWYTLSEVSVRLFPDAVQDIIITLQPQRREDVVAGDYPATFTATSQANPAESAAETFSLTIRPTGSFDLQLTEIGTTGRQAQYRLNIASLSDGALSLTLRASDPAAALLVQLPQEPLVLEPYRVRDLPFMVKPKKGRLVGEPERHTFVVEAAPELEDAEEAVRQTQQVQVEFVYQPRLKEWPWAPLPGWAKLALLTLLPLVLMAATLLALLATNAGDGGSDEQIVVDGQEGATRLPQIRSFSFEPAADGEGFVLRWDVDGAEKVKLNDQDVEGTEVALPEGAAGQYTLEASNEAGAVSVALGVPVLGAPIIKKFTANPSSLELGEATTLEWVIGRAERVEIIALGAEGSRMEIAEDDFMEGKFDVKPGRTTPFLITAENDTGYSSVALVVTVSESLTDVPPPQIDEFDLPPFFTLGRDLEISYGTSNVVGVTIMWEDEDGALRSIDALPNGPAVVGPATPAEARFPVFLVASNARGERVVDMRHTTGVPLMEVELVESDTTDCGITLIWAVSGDSGGTFHLLRDGEEFAEPPIELNDGSYFYEDFDFEAGTITEVTYQLRAVNRADDSTTESQTLKIDCPVPTPTLSPLT